MNTTACSARRFCSLLLCSLALAFSGSAAAFAAATLRLTEPPEGAVLHAGEPVKVRATAIDPKGYISRVEFFADATRIGVSEIAFLVPPANGTPVEHTIVWTNPIPGTHILSAVAKDSLGARVESPGVKILVEDFDPSRTVVRIDVLDPEGTELPPFVDAIDPIRFEISRSGPTNRDLRVFFSLHGTAGPEDYFDPGNSVVLAAGAQRAQLAIVPKADFLKMLEPMETVAVKLEPSPLAGPLPGYQIDPAHSAAAGVIYERTPPGTGTIQIALPDSGTTIPAGNSMTILAAAFHPAMDLRRVEFYSDDEKIGVSELALDDTPPPGGLYMHSLVWNHPAPGVHRLWARAALPDGTALASDKVEIRVEGGSALPVVSVFYREPDTKQPWPNADYAPGFLEVQRTGPTNTALRVFFTIGGSATPGVDYEKLESNWIEIPAGAFSSFVRVKAIDDTLVEGNETVEMTLIPPPAGAEQYQIDSAHRSAALIIYDNDTAEDAARIEITRPRDGEVFPEGSDIQILATAVDPRGYIATVEFFADGQSIGVSRIFFFREPDPGTPVQHSLVWKGASAGEHVITARGTNTQGQAVTSRPVRILVGTAHQESFVRRILPSGYLPGSTLLVQLIAEPPAGTRAWTVEDVPPKGWAVGRITGEGVLDPITGKVKFGFFTEPVRRTLTYEVKVPADATGTYEFSGASSANGKAYPVAGDRVISRAPRTHPADADANLQITQTELTRYAAAWKAGEEWIKGNPIPQSYVTRAALIWRRGEKYHYDDNAGAAPFCWVPDALSDLVSAQSAFSAVREAPQKTAAGDTVELMVNVRPAPNVQGWSVEEHLPEGWTFVQASEGAEFDEAARKIRWGVFLDSSPRLLHYTARTPAGINSVAHLYGTASFDGQVAPVNGSGGVTAISNTAPLRLDLIPDKAAAAVPLRLMGPAGQRCVLEQSADLVNWNDAAEVYLPDGALVWEETATDQFQRFYRLRAR